jgi:hypothetical protein
MRRRRNILLVVVFLAVLAAPTVASLLRWDPWGGIDEKRVLAKRPDALPWSWASVPHVPAAAKAWEAYFADRFGLRKLLIGSYRLLTLHLLRKSPSPAVVVGKSDGERRWLYFEASAIADGMGLDSFRGRRPYLPVELAEIAVRLREAAGLARTHGAKLLIAVAPDKQTIYPEYLPDSMRPAPGAVSRLDQFWAMAATLTDVPLVDLRIPLRRAKAREQLYYPTDTHWNWRAGLLAYEAMARALEAQDPSRTPLPTARVEWSMGPPRVGDLTALMGVPALGGDRDVVPLLDKLPALGRPRRGKLLAFMDSFFSVLLPFFETDFAQTTKIHGAHGAREILLTPALLAQEKPDVIIVCAVERYWTKE